MIEPIKDAYGGYYYRKYPSPYPGDPSYPTQAVFDKVIELVEVVNQMSFEQIELKKRIEELEKDKKMLQDLRK